MEQNVIIDIFQDIPLVCMAAILKNRYPNPTRHIKRILARYNDLKKKKFITLLVEFITLSGSITLLVDFYYIIGKYYIIGSLLHYRSKILLLTYVKVFL